MAILEDNISELRQEIRLLVDVCKMAKGCRFILFVAFVMQIVLGLFPASLTFYIQQLFTDSTRLSELLSLNHLLTILCALFAIIIFKQGGELLKGFAVANVKRSIELRYIEQLADSDYSYVNDEMTNRDVVAVVRESEMLTALVPMTYQSFIQPPCTIMAFCILILFVSTKLTAIIFLLILIVIICSLFLRRTVKSLSRSLFGRFSDLHQVFVEWLKGYRVFQLYGALPLMEGKLSAVVEDTCRISKSLMKINSIQAIAIETLTYGIVMIFLYAVIKQETVARWDVIISFPTAIMFIRKEAIHIARGYMLLSSTESAVRYLRKDRNSDFVKKKSWNEKIQKISFNNVSFAYNKNLSILSESSFQICADGLNVLIGPSGIGKTTTIDLITSLRKPIEGQILYNDIDISDYSISTLLKKVSVVEQDPLLFEGSYFDNIALGHPVDAKEVLNYANALGLEKLIRTNSNLLENVRKAGRNLSAGEKQRIAFIRALVKHPDVILLDEMTSNVDKHTSSIMIDYLKALSTKKIVLCITHDSDVINCASHIFEITERKTIVTIK